MNAPSQQTHRRIAEHFYHRIEGWFNFQDIYSEAVLRAEDGAVFVEIGAFFGRSTAYMAVEIINSGKAIDFYVVDTWKGSAEHQGWARIDRLWEGFQENLRPASDAIHPMRMRSVEAAKQFAEHSVDFLFLDGSHEYSDVLDDLAAWAPKIKPGGWLCGHDIAWQSVRTAVAEFCDEQNLAFRKRPPNSWAIKIPTES